MMEAELAFRYHIVLDHVIDSVNIGYMADGLMKRDVFIIMVLHVLIVTLTILQIEKKRNIIFIACINQKFYYVD